MLTVLHHLHVSLALASGAGFGLRGYWMLCHSPRLDRRWVRTVPHVLDSLLLASGVGLAMWREISPAGAPWLAAKLGAILVYIALGSLALRRGRTPAVRSTALLGALATFAYVVAVAVRHDPVPWR